MSFENFLGKLETPDLKSWRLVPSISQPTSSATTTSNSDKEDDTQPEEVQNPQFVGPVDSRVSQPEMNRLIPEMSSQAPISKELANRLIAKVHSSAYGDSYSGSCTTGQLWQFLLDLLTDYEMLPAIRWHRGGIDGEFVFLDHELVARLWGARKNKSGMNYEKLSRALRYYYDGDVIKKVHGADGKFVYKFVCDLKRIIGYHPCELNSKVWEQAALMRYEPPSSWSNRSFDKSKSSKDLYVNSMLTRMTRDPFKIDSQMLMDVT
ncbi:unnamed protein product [Cyprideis torosa]|uniref:Uncharacterized protein n=1 Tax=Cyprideis torosa TaxID=163714 RepID=A0A7R8VZW1_9CRUS|nr:unnamed protein product [Cyprideis torosa]CAG0879076.1 unnamed protein product [Cyprideis torosa]